LVCRICWVTGRVQGVFYRGSAQVRARELGITGYARNLADGCVEVLACGESLQVDTFIDWLWIGPAAASVTGVEIVEHEPAERPSTFTIA
jgi:acylphosphatase